MAAAEDGRCDLARVGGQPQPARHVGNRSQPSRLSLVMAVGQRPVGIREDDNADHECLDLDQLVDPVVGHQAAPPPDRGKPGAGRHEDCPERRRPSRRVDGEQHGDEAEDDERHRVRQASRGETEYERAQPDTGESLHESHDRGVDAGHPAQPNRDLEHHGCNDHDLGLHEPDPWRERGIHQLPARDAEQYRRREYRQPAPSGALVSHNPLETRA